MAHFLEQNCVGFAGSHLIAEGQLSDVAGAVKSYHEAYPNAMVLIFNAQTADVIELDLRGTISQILEKLGAFEGAPETAQPCRGRGRPKLGVQSKEITLLPRHWAWLRQQRGGASAALRRLVEAEMRVTDGDKDKRGQQQVVYKLMTAVAGDLPHYEDAIRALFAANSDNFQAAVADWPKGLKTYLITHTREVFVQEKNHG